jgi:hypothetical protein
MDKQSLSQLIAEISAPPMGTFQLAQVRELTSQIQRVKRSAEPADSKLAKIEHLLETLAFRPFTAPDLLACGREVIVGVAPLEAISQADQHLGSTAGFTDILTYLNTKTCLYFKTADVLADTLQSSPELDWSSAVILLCKAFELETVQRILIPLRMRSNATDLTEDIKDIDFSRIAKFCSSAIVKPPELGTFGHFLRTAIHSTRRRTSSGLLKEFYKLVAQWPQSNWIVDPCGLSAAVERLTTEFRNRAAHIELLAPSDYTNCRKFVRDNPDKIIVRLVVATEE